MTVALDKIFAGEWRRDPDAYDPYARRRGFTFQGRQFTAHSGHAEQADQWPMSVRDALTGQYVTTVGSWKSLPAELAARLGTEA